MKTCLSIFSILIAGLVYATDEPAPNFWYSIANGCKVEFKLDGPLETSEVDLDCSGQITKIFLDFPIVDGFLDPMPANASAFVLEKQNLNYLTNPEYNMHVHMAMHGNNELKVEIKTKDFKWEEHFKIEFQEEYACVVGSICHDFTLGNKNMSDLESYLINHPEVHPYLQELVNKIVENKNQAPTMAKVAAIFMNTWIHGVNPRMFYGSGILARTIFIIHCKVPGGCMVEKRRPDGSLMREHIDECVRLVTDP